MTDFRHEVIDRLGRIETKLDTDYRALHGNGKPGLIDRVAELERQMSVAQGKGSFVKEWLGLILAGGLTLKELAAIFMHMAGGE